VDYYLGLIMVLGTCAGCCGIHFSMKNEHKTASVCYAASALVMFGCNFIR
jgi:hypothetical protein